MYFCCFNRSIHNPHVIIISYRMRLLLLLGCCCPSSNKYNGCSAWKRFIYFYVMLHRLSPFVTTFTFPLHSGQQCANDIKKIFHLQRMVVNHRLCVCVFMFFYDGASHIQIIIDIFYPFRYTRSASFFVL